MTLDFERFKNEFFAISDTLDKSIEKSRKANQRSQMMYSLMILLLWVLQVVVVAAMIYSDSMLGLIKTLGVWVMCLSFGAILRTLDRDLREVRKMDDLNNQTKVNATNLRIVSESIAASKKLDDWITSQKIMAAGMARNDVPDVVKRENIN